MTRKKPTPEPHHGKNFGVARSICLRWLLLLFFSFSTAAESAESKGVYHPVSKGVTLYRISQAYKVPIAKLMEANRLASPSDLKAGQKIFVPGAQKVLQVEPFAPLSPAARWDLESSLESSGPLPPGPPRERFPRPGDGPDLIWPLEGKINSRFGPRGKGFHAGIDISSPSYQEVKAAMDGEVILAGNTRKGYGKVVFLRHDGGYMTIYAHLSVIMVQEGETVRQRQAIGGVGSTGKSTGPHLHFELRRNNQPLDPLPLLPITLEELLENASKR